MNVKFNIIKYRYHLSTIFLIILGICLNLPINKNIKLSLLIIGITICIFEPMLSLPFILVIFIMYNLNTKIKKLNNKKDTIKNKNNTIEEFTSRNNGIIEFINDTSTSSSFTQQNFADTINLKNRDSLFQYISTISNPNIYRKKIEFIDELLKTYFFNLSDYILITNLVNNYEDYDELYEILEFTDTTIEEGYNDNPQRNAQIPLLENESLKKLGILFYKNKNLKYVKYLIGNIYQLGFYSILNNVYQRDNIKPIDSYVSGNNIVTDNSQTVNYQSLKNIYIDNDLGYKQIVKSIKELVLLLFYNKNKSTNSDGDFYDFNKVINLENTLNIFEIFDNDYIRNSGTNGTIEQKIKEIIENIESYNLVEKRKYRYNRDGKINKDIIDTRKNKKLFVDFSFLNNGNLAKISNYRNLEDEFDNLFNNILDNFDNIKILSTELYNITDRRQRKRQELDIYNNLSIIYFLTNNSIQNLISNIYRNNDKVTILNNLYNRKKRRFDNQISNEEKMKEKYQFTSGQDIFYDNLFHYIKLKRGSEETRINKIYPEPENIFIETGKVAEEISLAPGPAIEDDEEDPFSRIQQREFELGLDDYLTEDQMKDKQEDELTKYYQFLDKENYTKIETLNKLAEERNENLKIEKLSLNNVVNSFGTEIFNIIDEVTELFHKTFDPKYTPSISPGPSIEGFHSGLLTSSQGPSPSYSIKGKENLHKYIFFFKELIKILTKEERIFHVGFILVFISLLIYFIDNDNPYVMQQPKNLGILQYL
jgi:hypothetical protein